MLPPGHIAVGYLVADAAIHIGKPAFDHQQINTLLWLGAFFSFMPDLDAFQIFLRAKSFAPEQFSYHRSGFGHFPLVWLVISLVLYFAWPTQFGHYTAIILFLGTWSHMLGDSLKFGVRWLWPFNNKFYALKTPGQLDDLNTVPGFFAHWVAAVKYYWSRYTSTAYLEIVMLILFAIIFFKII